MENTDDHVLEHFHFENRVECQKRVAYLVALIHYQSLPQGNGLSKERPRVNAQDLNLGFGGKSIWLPSGGLT